jgi:hypothetical protein
MSRRVCGLLLWVVACGGGQTVAAVTVTPATSAVVAGHEMLLSATATSAAGGSVAGTISWSSSDSLVATVSDAGLVTAISAGQAKITATQAGKSGSASITVDAGALDIKGVWASFENAASPSGYFNGEVLKSFDSIEPVLAQQMDLMRATGVNAISFQIRATDSAYTGQWTPPNCNEPPSNGALWPQPTAVELANMVKLFDLAQQKGLRILLNLTHTHFEETPPVNATTWLTALIDAVKTHAALELVTFMGDVHVNDFGGKLSCGVPAEPPLWLGPANTVYQHLKFELSLARTLGLDPRKISAEAIVGDSNLETQAVSAAAGHLYSPLATLKQLFGELFWPDAQRTYALSFYYRNKCASSAGCTEVGPAAWADQTMRFVSSTVGFGSGARAIAVEYGTLVGGGATPDQAVPALTGVMRKYGMSGGAYWIWVETDDSYEASLPFAEAILKRGATLQYNPVRGLIADAYALP